MQECIWVPLLCCAVLTICKINFKAKSSEMRHGLHGDCRGPPERSTAKQPAGYQAVLRANLHEVAVSAACIASKAGLVALGDASGDLSVLNLARVCALTCVLHEYCIRGLSGVGGGGLAAIMISAHKGAVMETM